MLLTLSSVNCASSKVTIPVSDKDRYFLPNGDVCFSEKYFEEFLKEKNERVNR